MQPCSTDDILFHGTAISYKRYCFLFLGGSGVGKTTFSAFACNNSEYTYWGDDLIVANPETMNFLCYPRSLLIREPSVDFLISNGYIERSHLTYNTVLQRYIFSSPTINNAGKRISYDGYILLNRRTDIPSGISGGTLEMVISNLYNTVNFQQNLIRVFQSVPDTTIWQLTYSDCTELSDYLSRLIGGNGLL